MPAAIDRFVEDVRGIFDSTDDPHEQCRRVAARTQDLLEERGWLEEAIDFDGRGTYRTFHVDEEHGYPAPGFEVMGFATSGASPEVMTTHDHGPAWVVYGVYDGEIRQTKYGWSSDDPTNPTLEERETFTQTAGEVTVVMPGELHATSQESDEPLWVVRVESQDVDSLEVPQQQYDVPVAVED